ncbi:hypothetical protein [Longispora fulva]|uniref:2-nitropropane dioxygenase n=1 Tax=Longispora fulva TaxID=619741 RepID=A0A8J7KRL6_9ACTN|nr:hypothetical protein [Longispora fulva]MBG6138642.1 hypothetical protein [Longispora fulva]
MTSTLGSAAFRADYGVRHAYLAGALPSAVTSVELCLRLGTSGLLGFYGAEHMPLAAVDAALDELRGTPFGMELPAAHEADLVDRYLDAGVRFVDATGYTAVTPDLLRYRFSAGPRQLLVNVASPAAAEPFLRPLPPGAGLPVDVLGLPVATDIAVLGGNVAHLLALVRMRDRFGSPTRIGYGGGLGTPEGVAAAFLLGADFVVAGSVNHPTPEAGATDEARDALAALDVSSGSPVGAFNHDVRGTPLADWRNRHVDVLADHLMAGAARILAGSR